MKHLKITSAITHQGRIYNEGELAQFDDEMADSLVERGWAEPAKATRSQSREHGSGDAQSKPTHPEEAEKLGAAASGDGGDQMTPFDPASSTGPSEVPKSAVESASEKSDKDKSGSKYRR
ncbi:MAG: hypothetical protein IT379_23625 [Deltaproteobacteria bacterium]|nr:hypothetical protein [Deltaproteobacteria bacterium]